MCLDLGGVQRLAQAAHDNDFDTATWKDQQHCFSCEKCQNAVNIAFQMIVAERGFESELDDEPEDDWEEANELDGFDDDLDPDLD